MPAPPILNPKDFFVVYQPLLINGFTIQILPNIGGRNALLTRKSIYFSDFDLCLHAGVDSLFINYLELFYLENILGDL